MIKIEKMSFAYSKKKQNIHTDLNLTIEKNKIYGLLGKNGTGKSTLLYLIAGLLRPTSGTIKCDEVETMKRKKEFLQDIFLVNEEFEFPKIATMTWAKSLGRFYPNYSEETFRKCLEEFNVPADSNLNALSMGQQKKIFISFAIASGVSTILMDEPTNGLDIPSKTQFRKIISNFMNEDRTIIISTHQVHDIENLLDHIIIIDKDKMLLNASTAELTDKYIFEYRTPGAADDDVIYQEPSIQGNATMAYRNGSENETNLNLELLFNAAISNKLTKQLNDQTTKQPNN